ncbi:PadR family transcriptional regulator [Candidatus Uabimicrobium sp. HlEnr_7]|uniref:PadR family transcriptional regulator n=1 Tax=Candidatus Uabimicrobium helgolandensis TaxID=3095367 RepID=UPI003558114E
MHKIKKELVAASSESIILSLLTNGSSYGYEIIQKVKSLSDGQINWTDGMLYPVLHRLEHKGYIKSFWKQHEKRKRKYYELNEEGKKALSEYQQQWSIVDSMLKNLWRNKCLT